VTRLALTPAAFKPGAAGHFDPGLFTVVKQLAALKQAICPFICQNGQRAENSYFLANA
jgi:hypothetical protein